MKWTEVVSLSICFTVIFASSEPPPQVTITSGRVIGSVRLSALGKPFLSFRGIPYAKPPLGNLRFEPPVSVNPWSDILWATSDGPACPQVGRDDISEDCLVINVYTSSLPTSKDFIKLRPVLVYIHGGGFKEGSSSSERDVGPEYFMDRDIVFVTFNYRLNIFGFISTGTKEAPGNIGLKDQVKALEWVQENIVEFGGDPSRVTLKGQSAGARAVSLHLISPLSENLFSQAILMSGSAIAQWKIPENQLDLVQRSAAMVNCPTGEISVMISCLKRVDFRELAQTYTKLPDWYYFPTLTWLPVTEPDFGQDTFLPEGNPELAFFEGKYKKIPIMIGVTSNEWPFSAVDILKNPFRTWELNRRFEELAPMCFLYERDIYKSHLVSRDLQKTYFNDRYTSNDSFYELKNLFSDAVINVGVHRLIQYLSRYNREHKVYAYEFDYYGRFSHFEEDHSVWPRMVVHTDDMFYLTPMKSKARMFTVEDTEFAMVVKMTLVWESFMMYGNELELQRLPGGLESRWRAYDKSRKNYLYISEYFYEHTGLFFNMEVWNKHFPTLGNDEKDENDNTKPWWLWTLYGLAIAAAIGIFVVCLLSIIFHFARKYQCKKLQQSQMASGNPIMPNNDKI